ncbi:hypothetical protein GC173_01730 [bacterium]|nr:hypothetical protein [bacterium]
MSTRPPLKFETERLKDGPQSHALEVAPEILEIVDDPEYTFSDPVRVELTLRMVGQESVLITGDIYTVAQAPCSRCLDNLRVPVRAKVTLLYQTDERLKSPEKYPELFDDNSFWFDGESVEPAEQLRELLLLELPPFPACELDEDDKCPISGKVHKALQFGDAEPASAEDPDDNSLGAQLRRMRKKED